VARSQFSRKQTKFGKPVFKVLEELAEQAQELGNFSVSL